MFLLFSLIMFAAWIWMIVIAFMNDQILWGVLLILFSALTAFIYGIVHWDKAKQPFILGLVAFVMTILFFDPNDPNFTESQQYNTEIERLE